MNTSPGRRVADVDPARLALLDAGLVQAATLAEGLAVDFAALLRNAVPEAGREAADRLAREKGLGISRRMALAARLIRERLGSEAADRLRLHPSDTVRGWACFLIAGEEGLDLSDRLARLRPLADDAHFGVREWAWLAVRPLLAENPDQAVACLTPWTADASERIRRYASEATRPRGVWCAHIGLFKAQPQRGLPILEPLRADPSVSVQNSVGNWLNDAAKDQPDWVRDLCRRWSVQSPVPATRRIVRRGLRTLEARERIPARARRPGRQGPS